MREWEKFEVLKNTNSEKVKIFGKINGIDIPKDKLSEFNNNERNVVPDEFKHIFNQIKAVVESEDRKTRYVLLDNKTLYKFKQGECDFYNKLDKDRIIYYEGGYGSVPIWLMFIPTNEEFGFIKYTREVRSEAYKNDNVLYREQLSKVKNTLVVREKKSKRKESFEEQRQKIVSKKTEERERMNKFYYEKGRFQCVKDRVYDKQTREYLKADNYLLNNWIKSDYPRWRNSPFYNIKDAYRNLCNHLFKKPDGLLFNNMPKLISWLSNNPKLTLHYFDSSDRVSGHTSEIDFSKLKKRVIQFGIKLYDSDGKKLSHPHLLVNGHRIPKDRLEIGLRFFMNLEEDNFDYFLKNINKYRVRMMEKASNYTTLSIEMPVIEQVDKEVNFTIQNLHNFQTGQWSRVVKELDIRKDYNSYEDFDTDSFYVYTRDFLEKIDAFSTSFNIPKSKLIDYCKEIIQRRLLAIAKGEELFKKTLEMYKGRVIAREGFYIIKGKLRNYKMVFNKDKVDTYTYPNEHHICVDSGTYKGSKINKYDKAASTIRMLCNDDKTNRLVHTLR